MIEKKYTLKNKKVQKLDKVIILNGCQRGCRKILKDKNIINVQEYIINNDLKDINEEKIYNWIIENIFK